MRTCGRAACVAVMLVSLVGMAAAADIRVLSVDAVQNAVRSLAADFAKDTGHQVIFTADSPAVVTQKIKDGEIFDAVIVSEPAMDVLDRDGIVNPESRVRLAKADVTTYEGGLMTDGAVPQAARAFIRFLAEPEARAARLAAKLEPLGDH
jgi:ABC-type molybdate transport system substrate-binding protein